jgi:hypothetical protein
MKSVSYNKLSSEDKAKTSRWGRPALLLLLLCFCAPAAHAATVVCAGCPPHPDDLAAAATAAGLSFSTGTTFQSARVFVLQTGAVALSTAQQDALEAFVRHGGSLFVALDPRAGVEAFRLSFILPSTIWRVNGKLNDGTGPDGAIRAAEWDREMFPSGEPRGIARGIELPFHVRIRPFDAVERGQGRYERFSRTLPYLKTRVEPGNTFWTRPLINRDWRIRLRGSGVEQIPLLITGRYGAGRVALFAAPINSITDARPFWTAILRWLAAPPPAAAPAGVPSGPVTIRRIETLLDEHAVRLTLSRPFDGLAVIRARTWERALAGDFEAAFTSATLTIPLPKPGPQNYQALDAKDVYDLRIGILSADGRQLLQETTAIADFRPALDLVLSTGDPRPEEPRMVLLNHRMGMPINRYTYRPGDSITATVTLRNGLRNIAPLAEASSPALNDEAGISEKVPIDGIEAYGTWNGRAGVENVIAFRFKAPVQVAAVTLIGAVDNYRNLQRHNPAAAIVELDGKQVAQGSGLTGLVRIAFTPREATVVQVRLPPQKEDPRLAEVLIDGVVPTQPASGTLVVQLRDSLTGATFPLAHRPVSIDPQATVTQTLVCRPLPPGHYLLEATYAGQHAELPIMVIDPANPLIPISQLRPPDAPQMGFIVTRGFRNVFDTGTGTREELGGWGQPDDLIWAYSHQFKQIGANARTSAARLYLSESDMRHYSTPWRSFPDGELFYRLAAPLIVERMKKLPNWNKSDVAFLGHSDRWDTAPEVDSLHGWQDYIDFDDSLRARNLPGLQGKTRQELATEIHARYNSLWQDWHLKRYIASLRELRAAFAAEHKKLVISAQGAPLVPIEYQDEIAETLRGESDDSTWGMWQESIPATTGRQMGVMAFNPAWAMSTLLQWNFDSSILDNPIWHAPAGATEPSRRHLYDRAFRGVIRPDGSYRSMHTYSFNSNAGASFTMTANDWQEWWRMSDRHALIAPDGPLGAGMIVSTARFSFSRSVAFSGSGGWGKSPADAQVRDVSSVERALHDAGVSVAFSGNAATLDKWKGNAPLILLDLCQFSDTEMAKVAELIARGVRIAAFQGDGTLSDAAARLFRNPHTLLIPGPAAAFTSLAAIDLAPRLHTLWQLPIRFPAGTSGYGFTSQGLRYIVLEDWREEGRTVQLRLLASPGSRTAQAADVNDNRTLAVSRDGDWWVIDTPLRPGDGSLICVKEQP